jgi:hypothetical protein
LLGRILAHGQASFENLRDLADTLCGDRPDPAGVAGIARMGDKLWMYPENKAGGVGFATLRSFVFTPGATSGVVHGPI